jgi:hypothetical protein
MQLPGIFGYDLEDYDDLFAEHLDRLLALRAGDHVTAIPDSTGTRPATTSLTLAVTIRRWSSSRLALSPIVPVAKPRTPAVSSASTLACRSSTAIVPSLRNGVVSAGISRGTDGSR